MGTKLVYPLKHTTSPLVFLLPTSGIVTFFYVSGRVSRDYVRENDILIIGGEKVKVLNVDTKTRRLRVLRNQENTVGVTHSSGVLLVQDPRTFNINVGYQDN